MSSVICSTVRMIKDNRSWRPPDHGDPQIMATPRSWRPPDHGDPQIMATPRSWRPPDHGEPQIMATLIERRACNAFQSQRILS